MASRRHLWMRDRTSKVEVFLSKVCEELRENELSEVKTWIEVKQKLDSTPTSRKNTNVKTHANAEKVAGTAQGRKYGYFFRNSEFPKAPGKRSAGCDSEPPIVGLQELVGIPDPLGGRLTHPSAPPVDQEIGIYA